MQFNTTYQIEDYILNTKWDNLPSDIQERTIRCAIDITTALILGSKGQQYAIGVKVAKRIGALGQIPVFGSEDSFNLIGATIAFSHAANSFDIDDGYNMVKGHPGASFVGGVLAAALENNSTYGEYLTTLLVCYETAIRWGLAEQDHYQFLHSTGTYGAFGTAAGIGRLRRLSIEQMNNALSIADYHAPLTPVMRAVEYPSMNKDGVPFGGLIGAMAVLETEEGETGKTHLLELPEYKYLLESLGERYYVRELYFKPFTCCRWAHQPIRAIQELKQQYHFTFDQVRRVTVNTFDSAAKLSKAIPHNTDEAQYNIAFPVACSLVHSDVGFTQINDEGVHDDRVLAMMPKLVFKVDPDMEKEFPEKRLAWVEIELKDGSYYKSSAYAAPGEHTDPEMNFEWIVNKFKRITAPVIDATGQQKILDLLTEYSEIPMREIVSVINKELLK